MKNGGPGLTWTNIIATLAFGLTIIGGGWVLFANQIVQIEARIERIDRVRIKADDDIQITIRRIHDDYDKFIRREWLVETIKRLDGDIAIIQQRLKRIEETHPTTGELQSAVGNTTSILQKLEDRTRMLENSRVAMIELQRLDARIIALQDRLESRMQALENSDRYMLRTPRLQTPP